MTFKNSWQAEWVDPYYMRTVVQSNTDHVQKLIDKHYGKAVTGKGEFIYIATLANTGVIKRASEVRKLSTMSGGYEITLEDSQRVLTNHSGYGTMWITVKVI